MVSAMLRPSPAPGRSAPFLARTKRRKISCLLCGGHAAAVIADLDAARDRRVRCAVDPHGAAARREFQGVVDQIGDRFAHQVRVAAVHTAPSAASGEGHAFGLCQRAGRIHAIPRRAPRDRFRGRPNDAAPRSIAEMRNKAAIVVMARSSWRKAVCMDCARRRAFRRAREALLEHRPHVDERRAQIMGDIVADGGELAKQALDFVEHGVDRGDHAVQFVDPRPARQPRAQVAVHDIRDGRGRSREFVRRCGAPGKIPLRARRPRSARWRRTARARECA